ncbi:class I SAM-dependent methyltransferase [Qipengyuania gelatinilytica]|uniref:Methyltransferase domain-containing protein n=1 Tax=Qipengyuania gelatinilytica TaxID=2867231 RepID=A0ABX9A2T3_9SPHN|nr:class I SAM-dependent methyltransferase [Qipengyuania gelatinilytica]QZD95576.1 methyltransferase domain-containing protein [Qipengyuania gelatinilytica]
MSADPATIAYYEANAPRYTLSFGQAPSRHLDRFLDHLEPGATVLELGCGGGRDSARIIERGFDLDATDGTPAMVRKANERFDVGARVMRFDELNAEAEYDAVWAHACLLHVARADLPAVLAAVRKALRPSGWHFANYKLGDAEGRDPLGRLTNLPDENWLEAIYHDAGFRIAAAERYRGEGADGVQRDWYALTLQSPES